MSKTSLPPTLNFLLVTFYLLLTSPSPTHAQVDLEQAFRLNQTDTVASRFPNITTLISSLLPNVFIISGLILLFIALGAGLTMITSSDNPEAQEKGKAGLTGAIIGFAIIFTSYWVIQIIEIVTGIHILNSP